MADNVLWSLDADNASVLSALDQIDARLNKLTASIATLASNASGLSNIDKSIAATPQKVQNVTSSFDAFKSALGAIPAALGKVGSSALSVVSGLTGLDLSLRGISHMAAELGKESVKMAGDFEKGAMTLVTSAGESMSNLKMVSGGILNVSQETGYSTEQLIHGMYMVESSGHHGADGLNVLAAASKGAKAENADLGVVTNAVTTILTDYASKHVTASQAMNALTETVANGKTNLQALASSMGNVLPLASSLNISFPQVSGAMAVMTNSGMSAQRASMNLANAIRSLSAPSGKAQDAMESVGVKAQDLKNALSTQGLSAALQMVEDHVGRKFPAGSVEAVQAFKAIMGGATGYNVALMVGGSHMKDYQHDIDEITDAMRKNGDEVMGWSEVQGTFNVQMDRLKAIVDVVKIKVGTELITALTPLARTFADMAVALSRVNLAASPLAPVFAQIGHAWSTLLTASSEGSSAVLPGIIAAFGRLQLAVRNFGAVIGPYIGPLLSSFNGLLTTIAGWVLSLVAPALDMMSQRVNALTAFLHPVLPVLDGLMIALVNLANVIGPIIVGMVSLTSQGNMLAVIAGIIGAVVAGLITDISGLINWISSVIRFFEENQAAAAILAANIGILATAFLIFKAVALAQVIQGFLAIAPIIYSLATVAIPAMITSLYGMAAAAAASMVPFLPFIAMGAAVVAVIAVIILVVRNWGAIVNWLQQQWQRFTSWYQGIIETLSRLPGIGALITAFQQAWSSIWSNAQSAWGNVQSRVGTVLDGIKQKSGEIGNWFSQIWANISTGAQQKLGPPIASTWDNIRNGAQTVTVNVGAWWLDTWTKIQQKWQQSPLAGISDVMVKAFQNLGPTILQALQQQLAPIKGQLGQVFGGAGAQIQAALSGMQPALGNLGASFSSIGGAISGGFLSAWHSMQGAFSQIGPVLQSMAPAWNGIMASLQGAGAATVAAFAIAWKSTQEAFAQIGPVLQSMAPAWNSLTQALRGLGQTVGGAFVGIWKSLQQTFAALAPLLAQVGTVLSGAFSGAWKALAPILVQIGTILSGAFSTAWKALAPILAQIGSAIGGQFLQALQMIGIVIGGVVLLAISLLLGAIVGLAKGLATLITGIVKIVTGVIQVFSGIVQVIIGIVTLIIDLCTGNFSKLGADLGVIWQGIVTVFQGLWNIIVGVFTASIGTVISIVSGFISTIVGFFTNLYNQLVGHSIIPDLCKAIVQWFTDLATQGVAWGKNLIQNIINGITSMAGAVGTAVSGVADTIKKFLGFKSPAKEGPASDADQWIPNLLNMFSRQLHAGKDQINKDATGVAQKIYDVLGFHSPTRDGPGMSAAQWIPNLIGMMSTSMVKGQPTMLTSATAIAKQISDVLGFRSPPAAGPNKDAALWIPNLVKLMATGMTTGQPKILTSATAIAKQFSDVLGFRSPPAAGPNKDAALWMPNMIKMLTTGMAAGQSAVGVAAKGVAQQIDSALGYHSPPKIAPLSDSDKWMPRFVDMLAKGLDDGKSKVLASATALANAISSPFGSLSIQASAGKEGIAKHARGILDSPIGHMSLVGEEGPEWMYVPQHATIFPNSLSSAISHMALTPIMQTSSQGGNALASLGGSSALPLLASILTTLQRQQQRPTGPATAPSVTMYNTNSMYGVQNIQDLARSLNNLSGYEYEQGQRGVY